MVGRSLAELTRVADPAWPKIQKWIDECPHPVKVLARDPDRSEAALVEAQVTTWSALGAVIYECAAVFIDRGWVRVLGGGSSDHPWSPVATTRDLAVGTWRQNTPRSMVIAYDVIGGVFALNGGDFGEADVGSVYYLAPDSARWEALKLGHTEWLSMFLTDSLTTFYKDLRWAGWEGEVDALSPERGVGIYPPLWSAEAKGIGGCMRRPLPVGELLPLALKYAKELANVPTGGKVILRTSK